MNDLISRKEKIYFKIKPLMEHFLSYQVEWLTSHFDLEFCEEEEQAIIKFLRDTNELFIEECLINDRIISECFIEEVIKNDENCLR